MSGTPSTSQPALQPTFRGYVRTTKDALILFEACLSGHIHHVPRRPHDRERTQLIDSGNIFIYEEQASGIKRWTDGVTWSPSRILGNFLVYRELEKPFPPGEKKRAMKRNARPRPPPSSRPGEPYAKPASSSGYSPETPTASTVQGENRNQQSDAERELFGSLVDSYGFKDKGLVKKTMSVTVNKVTHHLVSYYTVQQVLDGELETPGIRLPHIRIRDELWKNQSFRSPPEEAFEGAMPDGMDPHGGYPYRDNLVSQHAYQVPPSAGGGYYGMPSPYSSGGGHQQPIHQQPVHQQPIHQQASHQQGHHQPVSVSAYGMSPTAVAHAPSTGQHYYSTPAATPQMHQRTDYQAYGAQTPNYNRGFEGMNHNMNHGMSHGMPTSSMPTSSMPTSSMPASLSSAMAPMNRTTVPYERLPAWRPVPY